MSSPGNPFGVASTGLPHTALQASGFRGAPAMQTGHVGTSTEALHASVSPGGSSELSPAGRKPREKLGDEELLQSVGAALRTELLRGLPDRRGMLKKLGGFSLGIDALKSVVDRWVELRGPLLEYYGNIREAEHPLRKPKGQLLLDEHSKLIAPVSNDRIQSPYAFVVETRRRTEVFAAGSESEYIAWVTAIDGVLKTLQKFMPAP